MTVPDDRPPAREAGPELLVLQRFEEFVPWLLAHTARWPKSVRFTLAQRVENHALDVVEHLVLARYDTRRRRAALLRTNLTLERMRHLLRIARARGVGSAQGFESAMRGIDEAGRMVGGWLRNLPERRRPERRRRPAGSSP